MIDVHIAEELPALPSVSAIGGLMSLPIYRQDETENNIIGKILISHTNGDRMRALSRFVWGIFCYSVL